MKKYIYLLLLILLPGYSYCSLLEVDDPLWIGTSSQAPWQIHYEKGKLALNAPARISLRFSFGVNLLNSFEKDKASLTFKIADNIFTYNPKIDINGIYAPESDFYYDKIYTIDILKTGIIDFSFYKTSPDGNSYYKTNLLGEFDFVEPLPTINPNQYAFGVGMMQSDNWDDSTVGWISATPLTVSEPISILFFFLLIFFLFSKQKYNCTKH
ncbi:hypothetical protein [Zooshikella sp. RANM57]|uniref:hypothetical protein n=1 Tax=Zooshikella sp. RANM57 TaxID=3425863 RepID=UPI003D6EE255